MKLHLPKALITALTAVYAVAAPLATTVATGAAAVASQASAEGETQTLELHGVTFTEQLPIGKRSTQAAYDKDEQTNYYVTESQYVNTEQNNLNFLGLYITSTGGFKNNNPSAGVYVKHLYIDRNILFDNATDATSGYIRNSNNSTGVTFTITDSTGAWVDINADYGTNINVHSMNGGTVYLNQYGHLNTTGAILQSGQNNTVEATYVALSEYSSDTGYVNYINVVELTMSTANVTASGIELQTGTYVTRTLLDGNYENWTGTVTFRGKDAVTTVADSSGLKVRYLESTVTGATLTTRNEQVFGENGGTVQVRYHGGVDTDLVDEQDAYYVILATEGNGLPSVASGVTSVKGLYLQDGAGLTVGSGLTVSQLHIDDNISFNTSGSGSEPGNIYLGSTGAKLAISSESGSWVDINANCGANIDVHSMNGGTVYLNQYGYLDTTGAILGASNTVKATYAATDTYTDASSYLACTSSLAGTAKVGENGQIILQTQNVVTRTLLAGNYEGWSGKVEFSGKDEVTTTADSTGLKVSYSDMTDRDTLTTRNRQTFGIADGTVNVKYTGDGRIHTSTDNGYFVVLNLNGTGDLPYLTNETSNINGLYLQDGAGLKSNSTASTITVSQLYIGEGIVIDTTTAALGHIKLVGESQKFSISSETGSWLDINANHGSYIKVNSMANGTVYLNEKGYLDTTGATLGTGNTVAAKTAGYDSYNGAAYVTRGADAGYQNTGTINDDGQIVLTMNQYVTRTLLAGNYTNWTGTVLLDGTSTDYTADSNGLKVSYIGSARDVTLATRKGQTFGAAGDTVKVRWKSATETINTTTDNYVVLNQTASSGNIPYVTNAISSIKGLYLEDGAGLKINQGASEITISQLYIGNDITFASSGDARLGVIRLNSNTQHLAISSASGSWVDINADYGSNILLTSMSNGAVYLNENGKLASYLAATNQVYATLEDGQGTATGKHTIKNGYLLSWRTRDLLIGNFSSWTGTDNVHITWSSAYQVTAGATALSVDFGVQGSELYTGTSNSSQAGAYFYDAEGGFTLDTTVGLTFSTNTDTTNSNHDYSAAVIAVKGAVSIATTDSVSFTGNSTENTTKAAGAISAGGNVNISGTSVTLTNNHGQNGGAIYSEGSVTLTASRGDVTVTGNEANDSGGAIYAAGDNAVVTLAAEHGNVTFSDNTDSSGTNDIAFANGGTLKLSAKQDRTLTLGGGVKGGDVNVVVNGGDEESGVVVMGGVNEYTGTTTVSDGKLKVTGSLSRTSSVEVSGDGVLEISGAEGVSVTAGGITATANSESGTAKNVTIASGSVTGATSGEGDTLKALGEMSSVSLSFTAATTISNVTMTDSVLSGGAVSLGDNVTAVVSYASTKEPAQAQASLASLSGIAMLGDAGSEPQTVTATTVKTGGSIDGTLTVDIDIGLLSPANAGATLVWEILRDVTIGNEGFTLQFGSVLQYLLSTGHTMTLSGSLVSDQTDSTPLTMNDISNIKTGGLITGTTGNLILTVANIPEPTTGALSVLALAALAARRRRKK